MPKVQYTTKIENLKWLNKNEKAELKKVTETFPFRANTYYLSLIDWDDPEDPIKRIVVPHTSELKRWGALDASNESAYTVTRGCEHKYKDTAILIVNDVCGCFCRFCFRKRLFLRERAREKLRDIKEGISYISHHPEISNVLLTGGDSLLLATGRIRTILQELSQIPHVRIIRFGSKLLAFNPYRFLDDPELVELLGAYNKKRQSIYIMTHFNHPKELTTTSKKAIEMLKDQGICLANQTPLLRGVNDDPNTLATLFNELSYIGVPPYYVFINRPVLGNRSFSIPIKEALGIFEEAKDQCSGLAKRARLVMSHASGKIEVLGEHDGEVFFRFHRHVKDSDRHRVFTVSSQEDFYWLDQGLRPMILEAKRDWTNELSLDTNRITSIL